MESRTKATRDYALSQLDELFSAIDPRFFQLLEDKQGIRDLVYEMRGQDTGNVRAKKGAEAWKNVSELLRRRFNDAGGDIGHLEDWGMPQHHSMEKVGKATQSDWVGFVLGKLDRNKYVKENGELMSDKEVADFLGHAYKTIATGGMNKLGDSGRRLSGGRANRGNAERQIHFKDAEGYLAYQQRFGEKSMWDILVNHLDGMSKDIALVETYGPNPDHVFRSLLDELAAKTADETPSRTGKIKNLKN